MADYINWEFSGIENAARVRAKMRGTNYRESIEWIKSLSTHYKDDPTYIESGGVCLTIWHDSLGMPHAKVTISVYGVANLLGVWESHDSEKETTQ